MMKRSLFRTIAVGALLWGYGALEARAGFVSLPAQLDQFVKADGSSNGNFTTVQQPNELDTFSNFSYSTDPVGSPPTAANINLRAFLPPGSNESGLQFRAGFNAMAGMTVDYSLSYVVTAPEGFLINDAVLSAAMGNLGGTGSVSIVELLTFPDGSAKSMEVSLPGSPSAGLEFAGVQSILVQKEIFINGGSLGAFVGVINQGFSSTGSVVPEPSSMISLSIGVAVLLAFRRFSKWRSVA